MSLTARDIAEITRLLEDSSFDELDIEINGLKIHLKRGNAVSSPAPAPVPVAPQPVAAAPALVAVGKNGSAAASAADPALTAVRAPLLGTFYRAPRPGEPPFIEVGATVEPDTTVGIIEVMKLMNTVSAGTRGVVREICARDGNLVEYGETLLRIDARERA
jgi:acetyl-CoA carboxylase biotin carboxyl carrier protein